MDVGGECWRGLVGVQENIFWGFFRVLICLCVVCVVVGGGLLGLEWDC